MDQEERGSFVGLFSDEALTGCSATASRNAELVK